MRTSLQRAIRPSTTQGTAALWAKSLLNAVLFFCIFMVALPGLAHYLLPLELPLPSGLRTWLAGALALVGIAGWVACLDSFSRHGRGTPFPADEEPELRRRFGESYAEYCRDTPRWLPKFHRPRGRAAADDP